MRKSNKLRKVCSIVLVLAMVCAFPMTAHANTSTGPSINKAMTMGELSVAASMFYWGNVDTAAAWGENASFAQPIELYDSSDRVIAYYIKTLDAAGNVTGYMVVNASADNPSVLEFGFGEETGNILDTTTRRSANQKVYYGNGGTFSLSRGGIDRAAERDMLDLMNTPNSALKAAVQQGDAMQIRPFASDKDFGFIPGSQLPSISNRTGYGQLAGISSIVSSLAITSDGSTDNSCGPTSGVNVLRYAGNRLGVNLVRTNNGTTSDILDGLMNTGSLGTTRANYGKGMVSYINTYYPTYRASYTTPSANWNSLKSYIGSNQMVAIYVWSNNLIDGAHYVNAVGWAEYTNSLKYAQITNNWNRSIDRYFQFGTTGMNGFVIVNITR